MLTTIGNTSRPSGRAGRAVPLLVAMIVVIVGAGCGRHGRLPTVPVSGTVTLDGAPVQEGTVIFLPASGRPARGDIDVTGRFVLSTYRDGDGAIPGRHAVAVVACRGGATYEGEAESPREWLVPERYAVPETSGIVCEVPVEGTTARLALDREPVPAP